jgi:hypothetical protein
MKNLDPVIQKQLEFVEWLKEKGMYNPVESAQTMQKMHNIWEAAQISPKVSAGDWWRDLAIGEEIRTGDRFLDKHEEWVIFADEHLTFSHVVSDCTRPSQRKSTN